MILCYMDEAGNTGHNIHDPAQPHHYVGGLLVEEKHWKSIASAMHKIAVDALGKNEAKKDGFKFHGSCMFAGREPWKGISKPNRLAIIAECLGLIKKFDCRLIYGRCDKDKLKKYTRPMHPHEISTWLCYERAAQYANQINSLVSLVAASGPRGLGQIASDVLENYKRFGPPFGRPVSMENILDTVQFIPSSKSCHLQLCDLWLWTTQRFHSMNPPEDEIAELRKIFKHQFYAVATFPY